MKLPARTCFICGPERSGKSAILAAVLRSHIEFLQPDKRMLLVASAYEENNLRDYAPASAFNDPRLMIARPDMDHLRGKSPEEFSTILIAQSSVLIQDNTVRLYEALSESTEHFFEKLDDSTLFPYIVAVAHLGDAGVKHPMA